MDTKDKLIKKLKEAYSYLNLIWNKDIDTDESKKHKHYLELEIAALDKQVEEQESISDESIEREIQKYPD